MNALIVNAKSASSLAVIRSLGKQGIILTCASDDPSDFPLFSKYCNRRLILKSADDRHEERIEEIYNIVRNDHYDVLIPVMSERALYVLACRISDFEKHTKIFMPSSSELEILNNKYMVNSLLRELGLPYPRSFLAESDSLPDSILDEVSYPVLIKPCHGEAANGISLINCREDLIRCYIETRPKYGPLLIQEYINGVKQSVVMLFNKDSEVRRFFVHRAIRENPVTGGPTCFLVSVKYDEIFEPVVNLLKSIGFKGLVDIEFIIDERDKKPMIIDVNPRFYGPVQCAISSGVDLPYDVYRMALEGDIETNLNYRTGIKCRHLLFEDTNHMLSILRGTKSPKYKYGKIRTVVNYLNFFNDNSYFVLSLSDPGPALKKIWRHIKSG